MLLHKGTSQPKGYIRDQRVVKRRGFRDKSAIARIKAVIRSVQRLEIIS